MIGECTKNVHQDQGAETTPFLNEEGKQTLGIFFLN